MDSGVSTVFVDEDETPASGFFCFQGGVGMAETVFIPG